MLMDKPIYTRLPVLDLSKWLMYDFIYNSLRQLFPNANLLFTDTGSLCVSIETDLNGKDVYKQLCEERGNACIKCSLDWISPALWKLNQWAGTVNGLC